MPQGGCKPGGLYDLASKRWQDEQKALVRSLFARADLRDTGGIREGFEKEADDLVSLYFETFHAHANPSRRFWRALSVRGTDLRAGYLSHEWRTLLWKALSRYKGRFFKIGMVATYDSSTRTFSRHWISVTVGPNAAAWGERTLIFDPWILGHPKVYSSSDHERGNWLGTSFDEDIGPGGTLLDPAGKGTGGELGPAE